MGKKTRGPKRSKIRRAPKNCIFDKENREPSLEELSTLSKFLTERGKIIPRGRSGLCAKHQKELARQVKYARHLAMLPFVPR